MITNKELQISNKSYVNKDFASVYPELIELASTISDRWDPTTSNESDPGIVLLKEAAVTADKNNYNIDKNVLESFLPSATQENSTKMLCEMNGYDMKYYYSATTPLVFTYVGDGLNITSGSAQVKSFKFKKYETVVKTEDDSINYTLIQDCTINTPGAPSLPANAIEGTIHLLTIGDKTTITLDNLDENNRVYFPEAMIAQNGIFIIDVDTNNEWELVNNLNTQLAQSKVYKFGYDSNQGLPYVEFPDDVASVIGNGLNIRYTITSGINGNVPAGALTVLSTPSSIYLDNAQPSDKPITNLVEDTAVNNAAASMNGANPEDIESAYNNYKKTIGTFDTLVTTRDYANYIYNIEDGETKYPIVSNIQVADRRNDFNYSNNITVYETSSGVYKKSNTIDKKSEGESTALPVISPYDLCMYPLKPITSGYNQTTFEQSFKPQDLSVISTNPDLEESKCLAHNYKEPSPDDVYCFKNKYHMDIKLSTYKKMNNYQQQQLVNNVKLALYKAFNARMVDFGEEIPYESIKKVIKNADPGISDIAIFNVEVHPYVMTIDGTETDLQSPVNDATKVNMVAKNVLNGSISLFDYNDTYSLEFGQEKSDDFPSNYNDIKRMSTEVFVPFNGAPVGYAYDNYLSNGYTVSQNELIQFISPTLVSEITYPQYVNYRYEGTHIIEKDEVYQLAGNDKIKILYSDANTGIEYKIVYTSNSITTNGNVVTVDCNIFKPNFKLEPIDDSDGTLKTITRDGVKYLTLGSNQKIEKQIYSHTKLDNNILYCYWILNSEDNTLFYKNGAKERLLDNDEYFIYTNAAQSELVVLGSGTRLALKETPTENWQINSDLLDIEDINSKGLGAFSSTSWYIVRTLETNPLTIEEMDIISFAEGDIVTIKGYGDIDEEGRSIIDSSGDIDHLTNDFMSLTGDGIEMSGISNGQIVEFPKLYTASAKWMVRSRLNINCGPTLTQTISYNHRIRVKDVDGWHDLYTNRVWYNMADHKTVYFKLNLLTQSFGSSSILVSPDEETPLGDNGVNMIIYRYANAIHYPKNNSTDPSAAALSQAPLGKNSKGMVPLQLKGFGSDTTIFPQGGTIRLPFLPIMNKDEYILFQYDFQSTDYSLEEVNLKVAVNKGYIKILGTDLDPDYRDKTSVVLQKGTNIIKLYKDARDNYPSELTISHDEVLISNDTVYIGEIQIVNGYNKMISNSISIDSVLNRIHELATDQTTGEDIFYYLNRPSNDKSMDVDDILSAESLWDYNNVANHLTIGEIDFNKTSIDLLKTSKA